MFFKKFCFYLLFFIILSSTKVNANIAISDNIIHFNPGERIKTISIISLEEAKTLAVKTKIIEVKNPAQPNEIKEPTRELTVAPSAIEIAPKERRDVRLMLKLPNGKNTTGFEKIYRVTFTPETPSRTVEKDFGGGVSTKIDILIGMGALILVQPENPVYNLDVTRKNGKVTIINKGNISAEIQAKNVCKTASDCFNFSGKRVYPGITWSFDIPKGFNNVPFNFSVRSGANYKLLEIPAE